MQPSSEPALLFEVKLEFRDVRSGYRKSELGCFQAEWLTEDDLNWTSDMVRRIDKRTLEEIEAPQVLGWPVSGDQKMIQFLASHFRPEIWRHYSLGIYSQPDESSEAFLARCREMHLEECRSELRRFCEVFLHRFLSLEQRSIESAFQKEWEDEAQRSRSLGLVRNLFSRVRDDFSRCLLRRDFELIQAEALNWSGEIEPEFQDRLNDLRDEFVAKYNRINQQYLEEAEKIEPYTVPLAQTQIEILSRGILWK